MVMETDGVLVWVLRLGIALSASLLIFGMATYLLSGPQYLYNGLVTAGVFSLFATPITAVAASALMFTLRKDLLYTVISVIVFANLMIAVFVIPRVVHI